MMKSKEPAVKIRFAAARGEAAGTATRHAAGDGSGKDRHPFEEDVHSASRVHPPRCIPSAASP